MSLYSKLNYNKSMLSLISSTTYSGVAKWEPSRAQTLPCLLCLLKNQDTLIEHSNILIKQSVGQIVKVYSEQESIGMISTENVSIIHDNWYYLTYPRSVWSCEWNVYNTRSLINHHKAIFRLQNKNTVKSVNPHYPEFNSAIGHAIQQLWCGLSYFAWSQD